MTELSLFTGAGGGILGSKLLGWKTLGYVEWDDYCQQIIAQRIKDRLIDRAPIFGNIRSFIDQGYAASYKGLVDIISAGFPCQPFSACGHQLGGADERNMWPETIRAIRTIRPAFAWLENVPNLLTSGYFENITGNLVESGYNCRWCVLGADTVGSLCQGERLWILAFEANGSKLESIDIQKPILSCSKESFRRKYTRAVCEALSQDDYTEYKRDSDAVARGMERLKAIGNGQDPFLVRAAWELLIKGII
jgi:DNA (cytosine-5)-methyltransferase 1